MAIKTFGGVDKYKKTFLFCLSIALFSGVFCLKHAAYAWPGETSICPNQVYGGFNAGPRDGRCHQAKTINSSGATVRRGDTVRYSYEARSTDDNGGVVNPSILMLNWANIDMNHNLGTLTAIQGNTITQPGYDWNCIEGNDGAPANYYNCGPSDTGKSVYSKQQLSGNGNDTDQIKFNINIANDAPDGARVCVRFHVSQFNSGYPGTDVNTLIVKQINQSDGTYDITPVWAVSDLSCFTVSVPVCNPCDPCSTPCGYQGTKCTATAPATAYVGQTVTVNVVFHNGSTTGNDWYIGAKTTDVSPPKDPPYPGYSNDKPSPPGGTWQYYYPSSIANDNSTLNKRHEGIQIVDTPGGPIEGPSVATNGAGLNSPSDSEKLGAQEDSYTKTFNFTSSTPGQQNYYFGIKNAETGGLFASGTKLCAVPITWSGGSIDLDCSTTRVSPPAVPYTLRFTQDDGAVWDMPVGASVPINYYTFPDFNTARASSVPPAPPMLPHHTYSLQLLINGASAAPPAYLNYCMTASCQTSVGADLEPGQSANVTYGVYATNSTKQDFGNFSVAAAAHDGLSGSDSTNFTLMQNPTLPGTAYSATFNMTANYQGYITADLLYNGVPISDTFALGSCRSDLTPRTRATMRVTNGDAATGGGFNKYQQACSLDATFSNGRPRYISPNSTNSAGVAAGDNAGGIRTFAGGNLGGLLGGQLLANHCTTDYFNDTRITDLGSPQSRGQVSLDGLSTGQYLFKDSGGGGQPCLRVKGQVKASARVTIYTSDDVCINDNITYDPWNFDIANLTNTAPYLTIITTGNIYVKNDVSTITGLFIAQPHDDGLGNVTGGAFATCADVRNNGASLADANYIANNCQGQLNIKGSVIAQHVYPTRAGDTLGKYTGPGDSSEVFDYIPSMVVGQPNLKPQCGGAAVPNCPNNTTNLPPVF
jgi:hypothetical protein